MKKENPSPSLSSSFNFEIGGLRLSLTRSDGQQLDPPSGRYPQFLSRFRGNFCYNIHRKPLPEIPRGSLIFQGSTQWRLYQNNGDYLVEYLKPWKKTTNVLCIFKKDFSGGDLYFDEEKKLKYLQPILQLLTANLLSRHQGIMVHASGLVAQGQGFIFVGPSGAGKTTLANFWHGQRGVTVLNDERLIIRKKGGAFWLYGTPWNTVFSGCSSAAAPLKKIFFISHARKNVIEKTTAPQAFYSLFSQLFLQYWDSEAVTTSLKFCEALLETVPSFHLGFVNNKSAISFLKRNGVAKVKVREARGK